MTQPPARSYLFVPANRPDRFSKAFAAGPGLVVIDLEDAVPAAEKESAREHLLHWLATDARDVAVRINGADTHWCAADLRACAHPRVAAVMLPKAAEEAALVACATAVPQARLLPLVETAAGMQELEALGRVAGVERFVFGSIDFQLDMGIDGDGEELLFFRSQLVMASRLARLAAPVDGVTASVDDPARVLAEAQRARRLGFGAKLCIHPAQIAPVHQAFAPSAQDLAWARKVVAAVDASGGAAVQVDGGMVDLPILLRAREILARPGPGG